MSTMSAPAEGSMLEVRYANSRNLPGILSQFGISVAISTYQAGKLAIIGAQPENMAVALYNFSRPMGVAFKRECLAVACKEEIWFLRNAPDIARRMEPAGTHDSCFLARGCHVTGEIQSHEMHWSGEELWIVNTLFSCLCTLQPNFSFVPRWRPPFISALAAEDRCHLNGLVLEAGVPKYVTAMAESDTAAGWRKDKTQTGCVIDVPTGKVVAKGFAMPHSPRLHAGKLWLLDSGNGRLVRVDPATGVTETVANLPGYTRGLALHGPLAFIGLSKIRETSTFGGVAIAERREELKCGMAVVELGTGQLIATFEFQSGVEEIFDVVVLSGIRATALRGPHVADDSLSTIWVVPEPDGPGRKA